MHLLASLLLLVAALAAEDHLRVAPAPPGEPLSHRFSVSADGQAVPVLQATVLALDNAGRERADLQHFAAGDLGTTAFASFELRGPVQIAVTCSAAVQRAVLLPSASGIAATVSGTTVTCTIAKPGQYVLEIDGDRVGSLQLFANPWEEDIPDPKDPNVIRFAPGVHEVGSIKVGSGKTVYIADGAVLYAKADGPGGPVLDLDGDHIAVRGRGVIDASRCPRHARNLIHAHGSDISVEGPILRDSPTWTFPLDGCQRVRIANLKIFGYRGNSDGIDINNSREVAVEGCYLRTGDDLVVIKANRPDGGGTHDVRVSRCVLWNEFAHALSLGAEMRADVDGIRFADCDIIRDQGREWALRVYQCDAATVSGVVFEDIRIEECRRFASLWIGQARWSKDAERGHIRDIVFRGIATPPTSRAGKAPVELLGADAAHAIAGVRFERVSVGGAPLAEAQVQRNDAVSGVVIAP